MEKKYTYWNPYDVVGYVDTTGLAETRDWENFNFTHGFDGDIRMGPNSDLFTYVQLKMLKEYIDKLLTIQPLTKDKPSLLANQCEVGFDDIRREYTRYGARGIVTDIVLNNNEIRITVGSVTGSYKEIEEALSKSEALDKLIRLI